MYRIFCTKLGLPDPRTAGSRSTRCTVTSAEGCRKARLVVHFLNWHWAQCMARKQQSRKRVLVCREEVANVVRVLLTKRGSLNDERCHRGIFSKNAPDWQQSAVLIDIIRAPRSCLRISTETSTCCKTSVRNVQQQGLRSTKDCSLFHVEAWSRRSGRYKSLAKAR